MSPIIFAGDVAIAQGDKFYFRDFPSSVRSTPLCVNLEGAILPEHSPAPPWSVYNTERWKDSFHDFCLAPIFLANNHITDLPGGIQKTLEWLDANDLHGFGAGMDGQMAPNPNPSSRLRPPTEWLVLDGQ